MRSPPPPRVSSPHLSPLLHWVLVGTEHCLFPFLWERMRSPGEGSPPPPRVSSPYLSPLLHLVQGWVRALPCRKRGSYVVSKAAGVGLRA
jgi:hypothetical protein